MINKKNLIGKYLMNVKMSWKHFKNKNKIYRKNLFGINLKKV